MLSEAVLLEQNRQLRARIDELEETIRQFKERPEAGPPLPPGMPHLTLLEERIFASLWARQGVVDKLTIHADAYGDDCSVDIKIVDVIVCKLRRKLTAPGHPKIVTVWGRGYAIDRGEPIEAAAKLSGEVAQLISDVLAA